MKPAPGPATVEAGKLDRTPEENARLDQEADREFQEGRGIPLQGVVDWVRSWFTPHEAPRPKSGKIS
jgi:hypothetical protein